ncbi:hypothetical protein EJ06DRAFT_227914 [Trichodelitschia bisporula]|uniref:Uncharacterized protein n=1 Tax=Trichodelitschia bisporula TaxID=703511 RepID=A0A6G1HKQ1_9PEZI|nr:hypothetical protein EJ06DRAFT_227914 [Trichodelitschia bisporula]
MTPSISSDAGGLSDTHSPAEIRNYLLWSRDRANVILSRTEERFGNILQDLQDTNIKGQRRRELKHDKYWAKRRLSHHYNEVATLIRALTQLESQQLNARTASYGTFGCYPQSLPPRRLSLPSLDGRLSQPETGSEQSSGSGWRGHERPSGSYYSGYVQMVYWDAAEGCYNTGYFPLDPTLSTQDWMPDPFSSPGPVQGCPPWGQFNDWRFPTPPRNPNQQPLIPNEVVDISTLHLSPPPASRSISPTGKLASPGSGDAQPPRNRSISDSAMAADLIRSRLETDSTDKGRRQDRWSVPEASWRRWAHAVDGAMESVCEEGVGLRHEH